MSYDRSERLLEQASLLIPLGAQTFSKTKLHFPCPAPRFLSHGWGGLVYDVDGNEYVDVMGGLGCNILGYCDPDVDEAIRAQLSNGITFSLATPLELTLAERITQHVPCAEAVRFGKSGTDATTAAIRLARAFTGRSHIISTGYHGWADWSIQETNPAGVVWNACCHKIPYGDLQLLKDKMDQYDCAGVVVEASQNLPINSDMDLAEYLHEVQLLCQSYGTLFILDEVLTGFRHDLGGIQALYDLQPDLACLGKSMANGMPLSAVVGRRDVLGKIGQPGVFYSGTFFGETLSLAAAIATIDKLDRLHVCDHIFDIGGAIAAIANHEIDEYGLDQEVRINGRPPYFRLEFTNPQLKAIFTEKMCETGTLMAVTVVPCFAHDDNCVERVGKSLRLAMEAVAHARKDLVAGVPS